MGLWAVIQQEQTFNLNQNPSTERDTSGYVAKSGGVLSRSNEKQSQGFYSLKYVPTANVNDGWYRAYTLTAGQPYTMSFDFWGQVGVPYRAYFYDVTAAAIIGTPITFTGDGTWRYYFVTITNGANTNIRTYVEKDGSASVDAFYMDANQVENKAYPTTYCDGDVPDCLWTAAKHNSISYRSDDVFHGGRIIDLDTTGYEFNVADTIGVGMPPITVLEGQTAKGDGNDYEGQVAEARTSQLVGKIPGDAFIDLLQNRLAFIRLINPHRIKDQKPFQLRFSLNGKSLYLNGVYEGGLEKGKLAGFVETINFRIRSADPFFRPVRGHTFGAAGGGAGYGQGVALGTPLQSLASVNHIIQYLKESGQWATMGTGLTLPTPDTVQGVTNSVSAVTQGLDGAIYIAGIFTTIGGTAGYGGIAKWDGVAWSKLGTGVAGTAFPQIKSLAIGLDGTLYATGWFTSINGVAANGIAKWNGTAWSAMGTGIVGGAAGNIVAVHPITGDVWVGGQFASVGGVANTANLAKWNGAVWQSIGTAGANDTVNSITFDSAGNTYVGGALTSVGGVASQGVAKYNGSVWSAIVGLTGIGGVNAVYAIDWNSNILYVGGDFLNAGGIALADKLARYNTATGVWSAWLNSTPPTGWPQAIEAISPNEVYVGGSSDFTTIDGITVNWIAKWDGAAWNSMAGGMVGQVPPNGPNVLDLHLGPENVLLVAGRWDTAGGVASPHIVKWSGTSFRNLAIATRAILQASDGSIYVGGGFSLAGGVANTARIARWSPITNTWTALGTGANGPVYCIAEAPDGSIYIGGGFTSVGGIANTKGVARWNGSAWSALSTGVNGAVLSMAFAPNGDLYLGGIFLNAAGVANTKHIAKWNGTTFSSLGTTGADRPVAALAFDLGSNLYVGGMFRTFLGLAANFFAVYNTLTGTASIPTTSVDGYIRAMALKPDNSIVLIGGMNQYVKEWNGSALISLGSGLNTLAHAVDVDPIDSRVYVGGTFTNAGGIAVTDRVASYFNSAWSLIPVNLPSNAIVESILTSTTHLVFGFDTAGTALVGGTYTAVNLGSAYSWPVFVATGPGRLYSIRNITTGKSITFNLNILAGEEIRIDFSPGNRSVVSTFRNKIPSAILRNSDLEEFFLQPGTNVLEIFIDNVSATGGFYWDPVHWGFEGVVV